MPRFLTPAKGGLHMLRKTIRFDDLFNGGLSKLHENLREGVTKGKLTESEASDIEDLIPHLNFPGLMTLCAVGASDERHKSEEGGFDLDPSTVEAALNKLPTPVKPEEAKQIRNLLLTGQFRGDLADATATILHVVPNVPVSLIQDLKNLPELPRRLKKAIKRDLVGTPRLAETILKDLLEDGRITSEPPLLNNSVRVLYERATVSQIAETLHTLLGNESVRLAIIIYARSQGVSISQDELDIVREALDPNNPNLGSLLPPAYSRLVRDFGKEGGMELLQSFVL